MALKIELLPGESLRIGGNTVLTVEAKSGRRTRLSVESPEDVEHIKAGAALSRGQAAAPKAPATPRPSPSFTRAPLAAVKA